MNCFEPGRIIVGPGPQWSTETERSVRSEFGGDFEVLYDFSDVLRANDVAFEDRFHTHPKKTLPFVARVREGTELDFIRMLRGGRFGRDTINSVVPDYLVRPSAALSINHSNIAKGIQSSFASTVSPLCGDNCTVGIIDSGLDLNASVASPGVIRPQLNAKDPLNPATRYGDLTGHGSLVAHIVNQVAPSAKIVPVRAFDREGAFSDVLAGLYLAHAAGPCDIINLSFSINCDPDHCSVCNTPLDENINARQLQYFFNHFRAIAGDVLLIAAAGNNRTKIAIPAAFDDVIAVGSYHFKTLEPLSSYVSVPSQRYILGPDGTNVVGEELASRPGVRRSELLFGTSFATAFVSGVAARIVCGLKGGQCLKDPLIRDLNQTGTGISHISHSASLVLRANADCSWPGFDAGLHGLGRLSLHENRTAFWTTW